MSIELTRDARLGGLARRAATVKRLALTVLLLAACSPLAVGAATIYDSIPAPLPPNVPSLGYQATQTSEFGDLIQFAGTSRILKQVTLVMSDWALASDYPSFPGSSGPTWNHPLTLNLYNVDNSGANPAPGTLIATRTQTFAIPWRPPADPTCPGGTAWRASDGNCYSGLAFTVTFDFTGTLVPNQIIYGVAFNTQTWGYAPIGTPGPYVSLNFGLADQPPSVGSNPFPDTAYWNTQTPSNYADGGAGGVGIFRRDTNWTPFSGAVSFETQSLAEVPTLSPLALLALALVLGLIAVLRLRAVSKRPVSDALPPRSRKRSGRGWTY
ncbi:MAG TPA: hypothetical protein VF173_16820 [Thermoanaerobaculia bacterium]|nr:hypothetical protein [Thermoanaerobaculia bacterium]